MYDYTVHPRWLSHRKLPLYLPYKPYEFRKKMVGPDKRSNGVKFFNRNFRIYKVYNHDYVASSKKYPYKGYHLTSNDSRLRNRSIHDAYWDEMNLARERITRRSAAKKIAKAISSKFAYIMEKFRSRKKRKIHRPINRR